MSNIHSTFTCILYLLLMLLSLTQQQAQQQQQQLICGWPIKLNRTNTDDVKRAENGSVSCDVGFHNGLETSINAKRSCPPSLRRRHDSAGGSLRFPSTWYEAECHCLRPRPPLRNGVNRIPGRCALIRMPVTELRRSCQVPGNRSRLYYTEVTQLRSVDCDIILLPAALKEPASPSVLTGDMLRHLGRQVGRSIFMPVTCNRHHPSVSFGIDIQKDRLPAMLPEARCPCPRQAAVSLPIGVLRRVSWNESVVRSDIQALPVSCAELNI